MSSSIQIATDGEHTCGRCGYTGNDFGRAWRGTPDAAVQITYLGVHAEVCR